MSASVLSQTTTLPAEVKAEPRRASLEEDQLSRASSHDVTEEEVEKGSDDELQDDSSEATAVEAMKENPFESEGSRILFDAMDQLQSCIGNLESVEIDIPQLVICGSQSTGKSSLLQSLTDIPFPADQGCCTRFATRIVSRRTPANSTNKFKISIVEPDIKINGFGYPASTAYKEYVHAGENLSPQEFLRVMEEVSTKYMGIVKGCGPNKKNFATEVLKVELSGPSRSHFSILDVPGVFTSDLAVNPGEMEGVTDMVVKYMQKPENIVICVADAMTDLANQGTFKLAAQNVQKKRLVSVFTKCDLQPDPKEVVAIVTGQQEDTARFLGEECFVVRNRTKRDDDKVDLAQLESALFNKYPWTKIPEDRRGSTMLRRYLSGLLCKVICEKFPAIQAGIQQRLVEAQFSRDDLGKTRTTPQDMAQYLSEIVQKYEQFSIKALEKPGQLPEPMRLRQQLKDANDIFARSMKKEGHFFEFENPDMDVKAVLAERTAQFQKSAEMKSGAPASTANTQLQPPAGSSLFTTPPVTPPQDNNLKSPFSFSFEPKSVPATNASKPIFRHIQDISRSFQSTQLPGLINPDVLPDLFQKQTQNWPKLAEGHLQQVAEQVQQTFLHVLYHICPPDGGNRILFEELQKELTESHKFALKAARKEIRTYCERERSSMMQTTDSRFVENLRALRTIRLLESLDSLHSTTGATAAQDPSLYFDRLHYSMDENMVKDVHDVLKVYYQISIEGFIRHITHNIIEQFVNNPGGPLRGLSRNWVYALDEASLWRFGREDDWTLSERRKYDEMISKLHRAHEISQLAAVRLNSVRTA